MENKDRIISEKILRYCDEVKAAHDMFGNQKDLFYADEPRSFVYRNAVSMPIQQIGELAKSYSEDFLKETKYIPWKEIKGMRTLFAHQYDDMDIDKIWDASNEDIQSLSSSLQEVLNKDVSESSTDSIVRPIRRGR